MTENKFYDTRIKEYSEHGALQQLLQEANRMLEDECKLMEECSGYPGLAQFKITINGIETAFYAGGPQVEALYAFVNHLAAENWHEVDIEKGTVAGTL